MGQDRLPKEETSELRQGIGREALVRREGEREREGGRERLLMGE